MKTGFQTGMKVVCINNEYQQNDLTVGKAYTVSGVNGELIQLKGQEDGVWFNQERFSKVGSVVEYVSQPNEPLGEITIYTYEEPHATYEFYSGEELIERIKEAKTFYTYEIELYKVYKDKGDEDMTEVSVKQEKRAEFNLTGLEAVALMQQGTIAIQEITHNQYKIVDGMMYRYDRVNGWVADNEFNINCKYSKYLGYGSLPTGWEQLEKNDIFFYLTSEGEIYESANFSGEFDKWLYHIANYYSTKEKAEEINFKQTLMRRLQRFSDEKRTKDSDWKNKDQEKWFIAYNHFTDRLEVHKCRLIQTTDVYFDTCETALEAMELFKDDLMAYYTEGK